MFIFKEVATGRKVVPAITGVVIAGINIFAAAGMGRAGRRG